jgi:hypothetical protein
MTPMRRAKNMQLYANDPQWAENKRASQKEQQKSPKNKEIY